MLEAFYWSLFPAVGSLAAALVALKFQLSKQNLSFALHLGAGVVLGVVGVEIMPRILTGEERIAILLAFLAGSGFYVLLDGLADVVGKRFGKAGSGGVFAILFGVEIDMLTDGMMVAAGQSVGEGLGLLLGLGLLIADAPEAFATLATVRKSLSKRASLLVALSFPCIILLGVPLGYLILAGAGQTAEFLMLSFTAGILVLVVVEGLVPEAHSLTRRQAGVAGMLFSLGFVLFAALSLYLG